MTFVVFSGTDTIEVRSKAHEYLEHVSPNGIYEHIDAGACTKERLRDLAGGASLFGGTEVVLIDAPSEDTLAFDAVIASAPVLSESSNVFVLIEGKLKAADSKVFKKYASEYNELKNEKKETVFNIFSLTDALARRDKKALWVLLRRAQLSGLTSEEIIGTLFWQIKTMRLAARAASATEAGLKPFVYSKAKSALSKYKEGEVDELSRRLVCVYHDGHLGKTDINRALERFVLTI